MKPGLKLTRKGKIGYASAAFGDAASYAFINTFLLFFLTTVAGIEPAAAGTITIVGAVWNTLINPIIGYMSDNAATKWGRRRPFLIVLCLPLAASTYLMFTAFDMLPMLKPLYYGAMMMIFWTAYTGFFVPYFALGAEYTTDYNERTELRSYASIFNMMGSLIGMVMPSIFADTLVQHGLSLAASWSITGAVVGVTSAISIGITAWAAKEKDLPCKQEGRRALPPLNLKVIFGEYWEVMKLKPVQYLLYCSLFALICNTMLSSDVMYYFTYNHGLSAVQISLMFLYKTVVCIILILIVKKISSVTDKRTTLMGVFIIGAVAMTAARFMGIDNIPKLMIFVIFVAIGTSIYWQLMPAIIYDVCEYDELETGKQRQGAIVSLQGLVEALAAGVGAQILGIILQIGGFDGDAAVQSAKALIYIENCVTILPAIFLVLAVLALKKYPITKERFEEIQAELAKRKGEE
ncbi:MAG: MFS transporter [Firmicutes bacterium]|nr:MFS transporter [Bacillota bacterium]